MGHSNDGGIVLEYCPQLGLVRQMEKDGGGGIEMRDEPRHRKPDLAVGVDRRAILSYMVGVSC